MATREANWETPLDTGGEVFELLGNPRKAWIYTYLHHHPETAVETIVGELELPQRTVYDYVDDLEAAAFIQQSNTGRPAEYTTRQINLQLVVNNAKRQITPELIEAIARRIRDEDIDTYIDRYGLDGLAIALEYAHEYVEGTVTHQIMAREQEITPFEAAVVLDALRPVVEE